MASKSTNWLTLAAGLSALAMDQTLALLRYS